MEMAPGEVVFPARVRFYVEALADASDFSNAESPVLLGTDQRGHNEKRPGFNVADKCAATSCYDTVCEATTEGGCAISNASVFGRIHVGASENGSERDSTESSSSDDGSDNEATPHNDWQRCGKGAFRPARRMSLNLLDRSLAPNAIIESTATGAHYSLIRHLGQGAFGQVWLCTDSKSGELRAVKLVPGTGAANLAQEVVKTRHASESASFSISDWKMEQGGGSIRHVPKFYEASGGLIQGPAGGQFPGIALPELLVIVMEFIDGGCAGKLAKAASMPEAVTRVVLHDTCVALSHLHECGIIHRDVKGDNILISRCGVGYLCDFGISKIIDTRELRAESKRMTNNIGTPFFMAPEVVGARDYDEKVDIWSLGITAIELATGQTPWHQNGWANCNPHQVFHMLTNMPASPSKARKSWAASVNSAAYSDSFSDFLELCILYEPHLRASATSLLDNDYLADSLDGDGRGEDAARECVSSWLLLALGEDEEKKVDVSNSTCSTAAVDVTSSTCSTAAVDLTNSTCSTAAADVTNITCSTAEADITDSTCSTAAVEVTDSTCSTAEVDVTNTTCSSAEAETVGSSLRKSGYAGAL